MASYLVSNDVSSPRVCGGSSTRRLLFHARGDATATTWVITATSGSPYIEAHRKRRERWHLMTVPRSAPEAHRPQPISGAIRINTSCDCRKPEAVTKSYASRACHGCHTGRRRAPRLDISGST